MELHHQASTVNLFLRDPLGLKSDPYDLTWLDGLQGNESVPEVRQQVFQAS
jgi:hypothetical protein